MAATSKAKKPTGKKTAASKTAPKAKTKKPAPSKAAKTAKKVKAAVKSVAHKKANDNSPAHTGELKIGMKVPSFKLPATLLGSISAADLKGTIYVLYFYPKDDTSGCTAEACGFRDRMPGLAKLGSMVVGISRDSIASHEKFMRKFDLNFPLASDESGSVCEKFGTWVEKSMYGRKYMGIERSTFLIDGQGVIRGIWRKVSVPGHVDAVKKAIAAL